MTKWCVFCPEPRRAIGEVDGDPVCVMCGAESIGEFKRYREVPKPEPVPVVRVQQRRLSRPPSPSKGQRCWSPQRTQTLLLLHAAIREHVGKMSDRQVSLRVGCHKDTVAEFRKRNGIPAYHVNVHPSPWVAEANRRRGEATWQKIAPYVGKMTDKAIAEIIGMQPATVGKARERHGAPAFTTYQVHRRGRPKKLWPAAFPVAPWGIGVTENVQ